MEKNNGNKEVKLQVNKNSKQPQKLSYEELNQACAEMSQQLQQQNKYIQQLYSQVKELNFLVQNKRMDYMLKIIELQNKQETTIFTEDFYKTCVKEVENALSETKEPENKK
jgi:nitrate/nitrite-specific signal transduction histidine kinase